jgi:hypothetical protein
MNIKNFVKRIIEENNIRLINYFNSVLESLSSNVYTREEIQRMIDDALADYTIELINNWLESDSYLYVSNDDKVTITSNNKIFTAKKEGEQ